MAKQPKHPGVNGRRLGGLKCAARRCGLSLDEFTARRDAGLHRCYRCKEWKPSALFSADKSRRGGRASICKACGSQASTASRYRLTRQEFSEMQARQNGKCAICKLKRKLVVDHNHQTGNVRALLCQNCNSAIGQMLENVDVLRAAIAYLELHNGR